jgi:prepilin-type N-terminal cleavage/methylation domain-containing protein
MRNRNLHTARYRSTDRPGFTLVELLVVVAISTLLVAMLLPGLGQARAASRLVVCAGNLRQIGAAVHTYAHDNRGFIPRGPEPADDQPFWDFSHNGVATNQLWIGTGAANPRQFIGAGPLLRRECPQPEVFFCPGDDTFNLARESVKIGTDKPAYGSYIYRQLDWLPADAATGRLDRLGENVVGTHVVPVEALALDTNSLGRGSMWHANHGARVANVLFRDGSVRRFANRGDCLALPPAAFRSPLDVQAALDQLLTNADYAYRGGQPRAAPRISTMTAP